MPKTDEDIQRMSAEAAQVWNSSPVQAFITDFVHDCFQKWEIEQDPKERERLWYLMQAGSSFKDMFMRHLIDGKILKKREEGSIADGIGPII